MNILKIGFDLDGVILENPIRTLRPIAEKLKPIFFPKKDSNSFYFPKTKIEKWAWKLLHKTSFQPAKGIEKLQKLVKKRKIKAYLITGRYRILKGDFENWLKIINADKIFSACFMNVDNLQPNFFKEKMIKKLQLDIFVEDNWGIIKRLNSATKKTKIFWITNPLDRKISYSYKFNNLSEVLSYLEENFF